MKPEKFKVKKLNPNATSKEMIDEINEIAKIIDYLDITKPTEANTNAREFLKKLKERTKKS